MKEEIANLVRRIDELEEKLSEKNDRISGRGLLGPSGEYVGIYRPVTPSDRDAILSVTSGSSAPTSSNFYVHMWLDFTRPQTANNFVGPVWIAPVACNVVSIREMHDSAASGALTLQIYNRSGGGFTSLLSSAFDLNGVGGYVHTVGTLSGSTSFSVGDPLGWGVSGSVGGVQGVAVTVEFEVA